MKPALGQTAEFPLLIEEEEEFNNQRAVSDNDETLNASITAVEETFVYGTAFEKVEEYDSYLDEKNP